MTADLRRRIIDNPALLTDGCLIVAAHGKRKLGDPVDWKDPDSSMVGAVVGVTTRAEYTKQQHRLGEHGTDSYFGRRYHFYRVQFD